MQTTILCTQQNICKQSTLHTTKRLSTVTKWLYHWNEGMVQNVRIKKLKIKTVINVKNRLKDKNHMILSTNAKNFIKYNMPS